MILPLLKMAEAGIRACPPDQGSQKCTVLAQVFHCSVKRTGQGLLWLSMGAALGQTMSTLENHPHMYE